MNGKRSSIVGWLLVAACAVLPTTVSATSLEDCEKEADGRPFVCYDHDAERWIKSVGEIGEAGEPLAIVILNTDPDFITTDVQRVPEGAAIAESGDGCTPGRPFVETIYPEEGRYTLEIEVEEGCNALEDIAPTEFKVDILGWEQSVAGAFTLSDHRDPVFSTYTRKIDNQDRIFVEREPDDRENEARLGLGSFIHVFHEGFGKSKPWLPSGFSFGLGIAEQNRTTYSLGPSWRIGDKAFVTVGYSWAPVDRLPAGVRTCPRTAATCDAAFAIADTNRISKLDQRTEGALFVSLSYTFIQLGTFFQDRFREAIKVGGSSSQQTTTSTFTDDDLVVELDPATDLEPGDAVTINISVGRDPGNVPLTLKVPDFLTPPADLGGWEPCPAGDAEQGKLCFRLEADEVEVGEESLEFTVEDGTDAVTDQITVTVELEQEVEQEVDITVVAGT